MKTTASLLIIALLVAGQFHIILNLKRANQNLACQLEETEAALSRSEEKREATIAKYESLLSAFDASCEPALDELPSDEEYVAAGYDSLSIVMNGIE